MTATMTATMTAQANTKPTRKKTGPKPGQKRTGRQFDNDLAAPESQALTDAREAMIRERARRLRLVAILRDDDLTAAQRAGTVIELQRCEKLLREAVQTYAAEKEKYLQNHRAFLMARVMMADAELQRVKAMAA